jgi:hypothetical protein
MSIDFKALAANFRPDEVEWRIGQTGKGNKGIWGKAFAYITNRAIQQRLDEACGPENWQCKFKPIEGGFLCGIGIRCPVNGKAHDDQGTFVVDHEWVWKWDGADKSDFEPTKGGLSGAMKRAAVQWHIGRYLYDLEEGWVEVSTERQPGWHYQPANRDKGIDAFYWLPPQLPDWALPASSAGGEGEQVTIRRHEEQIQQSQSRAAQRPLIPDAEQPRHTQSQQQTQSAPPKREYKKTPCPQCGKESTVRKSKKEGEGWYCWKKITDEATGEAGCGHTWGGVNDEKTENPFGNPTSLNESKQAHAERSEEQSQDLQDATDKWARILVDSPEGALDAAITTIKKAIVAKRLLTPHVYDILKRAFDLCDTPGQFESVYAALMPIINTCFEPAMTEPQRLSFGEISIIAEDRVNGRISALTSGQSTEPG